MSRGQIVYALFGLVLIAGVFAMNAYGYGGSGTRRKPVPPNEVRNIRRTGTTGFIYWHHGMRGK